VIGPYYVNTDARRRAAWGSPCTPEFASITIDGRTFKVERGVMRAFQVWEQARIRYAYHLEGPDTGFYNCRHMRHNPSLPYSPHAWAIALDVNWLENPAGSKLVTNMPAQMISLLQSVKTTSGAYVFTWGGDWDRNVFTGHTYYDAMHWEVIAHPLDLNTGISLPGFPAPSPTIPTDEDDVPLKIGDRGASVKVIQRNLNLWQPTLGLLDDGIFGENTATGVRIYQQAAGFPQTGIVDAMTAAYITTIPLRLPK